MHRPQYRILGLAGRLLTVGAAIRQMFAVLEGQIYGAHSKGVALEDRLNIHRSWDSPWDDGRRGQRDLVAPPEAAGMPRSLGSGVCRLLAALLLIAGPVLPTLSIGLWLTAGADDVRAVFGPFPFSHGGSGPFGLWLTLGTVLVTGGGGTAALGRPVLAGRLGGRWPDRPER